MEDLRGRTYSLPQLIHIKDLKAAILAAFLVCMPQTVTGRQTPAE